MNEKIILTMKEEKTTNIMVKLLAREISINDATRLTRLSERQIYRKKKHYKEEYTGWNFHHFNDTQYPCFRLFCLQFTYF